MKAIRNLIYFKLIALLPDALSPSKGIKMKAIILTYAPVQDFERKILKNTNIFKLALNGHASDLKPDARIITDYVLPRIIANFPENIISVREKLRYTSKRVEYPDVIFKGSTIVAGVDYLILKGFDEILIVGDNKVNSPNFQNEVKKEIDILSSKVKIYQYSDGNFNLKVKSIKDFTQKSQKGKICTKLNTS